MRLLLAGSIAVDRIMVYSGKFSDHINPNNFHNISLSVLVNSMIDVPGGVSANIAYTSALLGDKPILFGSVGLSEKSYMLRLKDLGVDIQHIYYSDLPTATFTVMTDSQNCQIGGFYPGAMSDSSELVLKQFKNDVFVVISPHDPKQMAIQVKECRQRNLRLFYDVGQQVSNLCADDLKEGIDAAELLIVNNFEMEVLIKKTGWSKTKIQEKVKTCVITQGEKGAIVVEGGKEMVIKPIMVSTVVDPTGAGDAFRAGFLHGYLLERPLEICAQYGSTAASFTIECSGAQSHFFTEQEFLARYNKNYSRSKHG